MLKFWARLRATEPARLAEAIRTLMVVAVTLGWVSVPDTTINTIVSVAGLIGSWLLTKSTRATVTPVAKLDS